MKVIRSEFFSKKDIEVLRKNHLALNVNLNEIIFVGKVEEEQILLHIIVDNLKVGFIILKNLGEDEFCPFDGNIFEVTIAMYQTEVPNNYSKEAFGCLDNWIFSNYGKTRLEVVVRQGNPQPQYIESALIKANYKHREEICNQCSIGDCAYRGLLGEWQKIVERG